MMTTQNGKPEEVRSEMISFWKDHSQSADLTEMMLDSDANTLSQEELPEILSLLPDYSGKRILELGAGIGRFTGVLAETASHVTAVDFMESFVEKNRINNGHHKNVEFLQADVIKLELEKESYDLVFSNWLMMYLSNDETKKLADKMLSWVKVGGHIFFRESCYHQSGDKARKFNPTVYREPSLYNEIFQGVTVQKENTTFGLDLIFSQSVQTYVKRKSNQNQICWLMEKTKRETTANQGYATFQKFLDSQQYTRQGILRYEKIFGFGYVSTGGPVTTKEFVPMLDLQPGQKVLDVGCGIGGGDFYMAKDYNVSVLGMDLSVNMVDIAIERSEGLDLPVKFEVGDITKREYPPESFDVVYSRDTILHIQDKVALFAKFLKWLKPGGKLLISDYCCGEPPHSEEFKAYVKSRGYILYTPKEYGKLIESVGFINVRAEDRSNQFVDVLTGEMERITREKGDFLKDFSENDFKYLMDGWSSKVKRVKANDQAWGLFYAEKAK